MLGASDSDCINTGLLQLCLRFSEDLRFEEHLKKKKMAPSHFQLHSKCIPGDLLETETWQRRRAVQSAWQLLKMRLQTIQAAASSANASHAAPRRSSLATSSVAGVHRLFGGFAEKTERTAEKVTCRHNSFKLHRFLAPPPTHLPFLYMCVHFKTAS